MQQEADPPAEGLRLAIDGMSCATCARRVEEALRKQPGVVTAQVNPVTEIAHVAYSPAEARPEDLIAAVEAAGYGASVHDAAAAAGPSSAEQRAARRDAAVVGMSVLLTLPLLAPMGLVAVGVHWMLPGWLQCLLATPVQLVAGARFYRAAWSALRAGVGNMDLLVALGTSAAYGLSVAVLFGFGAAGAGTAEPPVYFEASAAVITFVLLGRVLEARAKRGTHAAIRSLMALRPETARVLRHGGEVEVPAEAVGRGEVVAVRPGERVPVDGRIVEGESQLDESLLTGESLPVTRGAGDPVIGGSINGAGRLVVETTHAGADSALARIVGAVEQAQDSRAPIQRTVDRVSAVFVPVVVGVAAVTLSAWLVVGAGVETAVLHAVSTLVIACPCALGLATPTALVVGMGAAARAGFLIRDAEALERACAVDAVVFDKTGTLTEGRPFVRGVRVADGGGEDALLALTASAQTGSEHPLGEAVVREARARGLALSPVSDFQALAGRGLQAMVSGRELRIGSRRWMAESGVETAAFEQEAAGWEEQGATVMWIAAGAPASLLGIVAVGDRVREGSADAVTRLARRGVESWMITGDDLRTARVVAEAVGIERVVAQVLPEEKAREVEKLRADHRAVAMVGDGINDAPALAAADVGFALSTGTDVAMHTASVTLMRPDPGLVPDALSAARATARKIRQNLFWAFAYNTIGIPLAAFGQLSPVVAGAAMALSSVSVVANSLLLRGWRPAARAPASDPLTPPPR